MRTSLFHLLLVALVGIVQAVEPLGAVHRIGVERVGALGGLVEGQLLTAGLEDVVDRLDVLLAGGEVVSPVSVRSALRASEPGAGQRDDEGGELGAQLFVLRPPRSNRTMRPRRTIRRSGLPGPPASG